MIQNLFNDCWVFDTGNKLDGIATMLTGFNCPCPSYILISRSVKVTAGGVEIGILKNPGDTFGEMAAILEQPVSATVEAVENSEVYGSHYVLCPRNSPRIIAKQARGKT